MLSSTTYALVRGDLPNIFFIFDQLDLPSPFGVPVGDRTTGGGSVSASLGDCVGIGLALEVCGDLAGDFGLSLDGLLLCWTAGGSNERVDGEVVVVLGGETARSAPGDLCREMELLTSDDGTPMISAARSTAYSNLLYVRESLRRSRA
eukprot:CAMPEP_0197858402 /NCGR_PEP_ID=MMETSP1438-20131217/32195_1 /TAXON_ID=1461541 /ORGANISM="Pterosperma sp., Strain CCMP1384" /LENGTH=147 /DNA_ID=CAMNT_0043474555 /DNA_START=50 /DNA_END=493 /DNA_ORIENTATION=-